MRLRLPLLKAPWRGLRKHQLNRISTNPRTHGGSQVARRVVDGVTSSPSGRASGHDQLRGDPVGLRRDSCRLRPQASRVIASVPEEAGSRSHLDARREIDRFDRSSGRALRTDQPQPCPRPRCCCGRRGAARPRVDSKLGGCSTSLLHLAAVDRTFDAARRWRSVGPCPDWTGTPFQRYLPSRPHTGANVPGHSSDPPRHIGPATALSGAMRSRGGFDRSSRSETKWRRAALGRMNDGAQRGRWVGMLGELTAPTASRAG